MSTLAIASAPAAQVATPLARPGSMPPAAHAVFNASLHGARGLLALLVFVFHIACSGVQGFAAEQWTLPHAALISLQFGVEMFFCISGFIVVGALERAGSPAAFLRDRAIRILPVLWTTLAIIVPLGLLTHQAQFAGLGSAALAWIIPANLFAVAGVLPIPVLHMAAWSLSYELLFYAVAAGLWWLPARQRTARAALALLAGGLVVWHPRAVFFAVGVLVARIDLTRHAVAGRLVQAPGCLLLAFMACWYWVQFGGGGQGDASALAWVGDGRIGVAALAVSLAILAFAGIVAGHGLLGPALRTMPLQWLGSCSYSFYLWHLIVIAIAKRGFAILHVGALAGPWTQPLLLLACLPASLVVAHGSMVLLEKGVSNWCKQRRLSARRLPAQPALGHAVEEAFA